MKSRLALSVSAGCATAVSIAVTVLAAIGVDEGYDWHSAQCGATAEVYPELGWLFVVMPLAAAGVLFGAAALWLGLKRRPPGTWAPWMVLVVAVLLGGCAAVLSAIMLLDPCGAGS